MKICLLTYRGNMYCGGQGIYIHYLSRELRRLGHEIHVISGPPYPTVPDGVTLHKLKSHSTIVSQYGNSNHSGPIRSPLDLYEFAATRMGVYTEPLAFSMRAYQEIKRLIGEVTFDIIHDNQCLGYGLTMMKRLELPLVTTIHHPISIDREADFGQARSRLERLRRRWFYSFYIPMQSLVARRVDQVITVSECSALEIERLIGIPTSRIRVVYNGVDTNLFRNNNGIAKEARSMIFVGNTEDRKKGIIHLLQALRMIKGECPVKLTIVDGGAPETTYAPALVSEYGLESQVTIVRRLSSEDLVRRYSSAEIAAVPSLFEGFGFPAAEAMACELPVITTKAGALPELVSDGDNGILIDPGDVRALAAAIKLLLEDKEMRHRMGHAGREKVKRKFNWEQAAKQTLEAYQQAM
ncbi:MAG: glycosyltransferase family 4 protein [Dehalococcoidia bacterium]|nr:MAG: glycosyltransferase family 4 protein [Dehalococcoidia bacterium]